MQSPFGGHVDSATALITLLTSLSWPLVGLALRGHGSKDVIKLSNSYSLTRLYWSDGQPVLDNINNALRAVETRLRQVPGAYVELEFGTLGSSQKALDPTS